MIDIPLLEDLRDLPRFRTAKPAAWAGVFFVGFLALSLSLTLLLGGWNARRVFLFPSDSHTDRRVHDEVRNVSDTSSLEGNVRRYVDECMLGPSHQESSRLFPRDTRVETSILQGRTLYLNLSTEVFAPRDATMLAPQEAMSLMKEAIRMNFPRIQEIVVFVDGQTPYFP